MDLAPFIEEVKKQKLKVEGIVVNQGEEGVSHRFISEARRNVYSVSKSFTSIAIGMAVDEGKLKLSDLVTDFFPHEGNSANPDSDKRWNSLTLENLLTMTMGHAEFCRPQSVKEALSYELEWNPGNRFFYDNTSTFLASAMFTNATGRKVLDCLTEKLFGPLDIPEPYWPESKDGYTIGATGLELNTSEMALFGSFLLRRGNWKGKQLVSSSWIEGATRTQVPTRPDQSKPDYDLGYGYQFWTCRHGAFRCDGKDGQFIIVLPALDAVIAINSEEENMKNILWAVWDYVLPGLR